MIPLKQTNQQVIEKDRALKEAGSIGGAGDFAINVALDRFVLRPFIEALNTISEPSVRYIEYNRELNKVHEKYGISRVDGDRTFYSIPDENLPAWTKAKEKLDIKYAKTIRERERQMAEYEETLKKPANSGEPILFHPIPKDCLPEEMTGNDIFDIIDLIEIPPVLGTDKDGGGKESK